MTDLYSIIWQATIALCIAQVTARCENFDILVCGAAPDAASDAVLTEVLLGELRRYGRPAARSHACTRSGNKYPQDMLMAMADGHAHVVLTTTPAAEPLNANGMHSENLAEVGDASPVWRRACVASRPPARSLLDLADADLASVYHLEPTDLCKITKYCCNKTCDFTPSWCKGSNSTCATILTKDDLERDVLAKVVATHRLHAEVRAVGPRMAEVAKALPRPVVTCDISPITRNDTKLLGPPPCFEAKGCPFEPMRLVKIVNSKYLGRYPSVRLIMEKFKLDPNEIINMTAEARIKDPTEVAKDYITKHKPTDPKLLHEVRVMVLLPLDEETHDKYDSKDLKKAAGKLSTDIQFNFEVQIKDDRCSAAWADRFLTDSLGSGNYQDLTAVVGPACGVPFAAVSRQAHTYHMPVIAFTPQAPPASYPAAARLTLLAAGDSRRTTDVVRALLTSMKWHRMAVLYEDATKDLQNFDLGHILSTDLRDNSTDYSEISKWATRAAKENYKILYLCVEDMRAARAALCAGHEAGLTPSAGAVWILPSSVSARWATQTTPNVSCTTSEMAAMAEGHLRIAPSWEAHWTTQDQSKWDTICKGCTPQAALFYDILKLWALTLKRVLIATPTATDDSHCDGNITTMFHNVITTQYTGLTGTFEWHSTGGTHARSIPYVIQQWNNKSYNTVWSWNNGSLKSEKSVRWMAADGKPPEDGSAVCALQPLADLLLADCRTAFIVLATLLLAALVGALASLALYCRRRAEREYRAHLEALRLRTYGLKPGGLDRWEVPRERVVINRKLGTGAFGTVYGGHALLAEDRGWNAVAVKTLKAGATTEEKLDFLSEAEAMKRFDHKNVVRLLAVVTKTEPVCTVMEFMLYGDLKNYLLARRHLATESGLGDEAAEEVSPRRLTAMALDVARALSYLAQLRYVHRDVAARNCLVSANRVVKLADFGMTRLVFENDYYRFSRKGMLPVRWMAPESLALGVFSPASDVWSFGVLLYEIVTFGSLPFQGLSNSEVLGRVKAGHTLDLPTGMKPQLEGLIKSCWQEAKARPNAVEVAAFLADSPRLLTPCLDVPLDALPLDHDPPWRAARDRAEARWVSWAAPASATTDTTYLSADARPPSEADALVPPPATP